MRHGNNRNRSWIGVILALLLVCEMASITVLFSRVVGYTQAKFYNLVNLEGDIIETEMEIFHLSYDNESGKTTVTGNVGNTDKLFAPGTGNTFEYTLHNITQYNVDYFMTIEARMDGTDLWLPLQGRVWDYTGKYLAGSKDAMVDVLELNGVEASGALGADKYAPYTLEWEWPFERGVGDELTLNDAWDTMLGDLAVDDDLSLTIVIRVIMEYDLDTEEPGPGLDGPPKTGDEIPLGYLIAICAVALVGLVLLLVVGGRRKNEGNRKDDNQKRNG